jgi:hypothetical protein
MMRKEGATMRFVLFACSILAAQILIPSNGTRAQVSDPYLRDIETKYIFGITEGSGIGLEGEKEFSPEAIARFGKAGGQYFGSETKLEYEFTPNQYVQFELGPLVSGHRIKDVPNLDNRNEVAFGGFFGEMRYQLLDRGATPLAMTLSVEPVWRRIDETSGVHVNNFEFETKVNADFELVPNRLYIGSNLLYEPEMTKDPDHIGAGWAMESTGGVSVALAYRVIPQVFVGGELWYLHHYDGAWFNHYTGSATYLGPTLYVQITPKVFMTAAWNVQVRGTEVDDPTQKLNLSEFSRQRAKFKVAVEF